MRQLILPINLLPEPKYKIGQHIDGRHMITEITWCSNNYFYKAKDMYPIIEHELKGRVT